ncbi:acetate--CoA ligase family protein, partial [Klebsiella pneumoniae]|uniref:ATP-grasp domain-containing protein n=1 Tax=Klebsiella pneumoniae TaxID=573 RepID=UPI003A8AD032
NARGCHLWAVSGHSTNLKEKSMNLHEYQAKELLASYGLPVQGGILAHNGEDAAAAYDPLGGKFAVDTAQVHAGGRGKAGGVKVVKSREEAKEVAESLIGTNL